MSVISDDELSFDEWNDPPDDMAEAAMVQTEFGKFTKEQMKLPYPWCFAKDKTKCLETGRCQRDPNCGE